MPIRRIDRLPLGMQVALGATMLTALVALGLMTLLTSQLRANFLADRGALLTATANMDSTLLRLSIDYLRQDPLFLSNTPPIRGIVRAARSNAVDARDDNSLETWRKRLGEFFSAFAEAHPEYFQIRFIGVADQGREIVRVDLRDGYVVTAPPSELQRKADRDYFQDALKLKAGEVYLSKIDLNREHGNIQVPHLPTLRAATPVFGPDGEVFGIVVINLDFRYLARGLASNLARDVSLYVANTAGDYLEHPEAGRSFGFDLGRRYRWQDDLPGLQVQPASATMRQTQLQHLAPADGSGKVYAVARQVAIDPLRPERNLLLIYAFPEATVDADVARERQPIFIGVASGGLLILALLLWLVRRTFSPLERLTQATQAIATGRYDAPLPAGGAGEIGSLVQGFNAMQQAIALRDAQDRAIVETASDGFWIIDAAGRILDVNEASIRLSGYTREELLSMDAADLKAMESPGQVRQRMQEIKRSGSLRFETEHRRKDGSLISLEISAAYWPIQGGRYFAFLRDIGERKAMERERGERENMLRSVLDSLRTSIAVLDPKGVIVRVNQTWRDFAAMNDGSDLLRGGVGLDYLAACRHAAVSDPLAAEALAGLEAIMQGALPSFTMEYPCHSPAAQCWFVMFARPLSHVGEGMVITHFDITQRKLSEIALRRDSEQKEALRRILEIVLDGRSVETTLLQALQVLFSVEWLSLMPMGGVFRLEEGGGCLNLLAALDLPPEILLQCARLPLGRCHCGRAAASGEIEYAARVDDRHGIVYPDMADHGHYCVPIVSGTRKLGVMVVYLPADTPRNPDSAAFLTSVCSILAAYLLRTDAELALIAYRQRLEETVRSRTEDLQISEARARAVWKTMLDGVAHIDANGIILSVNHTILEMFGYEEEELLGCNVSMLMPEPHASAHDGYLRRYARTRQARIVGSRREVEGRHRNGGLVPLELAVNEMVDDQGSTFIGVIRDMTLQKKADIILQDALETAKAAAQTKSRFLANMSHEIRTPLNAVLGLAQIGMRDGAGTQAGETFRRIADAGEHLLGVINDILDISKIEAGKLKIEKRPFALRATIDGVVSFVVGRAEAKGLTLSVLLAPGLPEWVSGDGLRIAQILTNLLSNAIKFTAAGQVGLRVACVGDDFYFKVIDTGIGMDEEQRARLFRPFEQADDSTTRIFGGTGLGLAISLDIARMMGGDIELESRPGAGSSFTLHLPLPAVAAPEHPAGPGSKAGTDLSGYSVLAADDVEVNRLVLEDILAHEGAYAVFAENGQQALERLEETGVTAFDVVLMDVQMPVMDGFEATRRIRAIAPALPVIGLTAHALSEEREKCLAAGMADVVTKPIDIRVLVQAIRRQAQARDRNGHAESNGPAVAASQAPASASSKETSASPGGASSKGAAFEATPAADIGAIDWPALLARYNGRRDFVERLGASARDHHIETASKLRAAALQGDREALTFMAHSLKGISGNLEARRLHALAKDFEAAMRAGGDVVAEQVDALADALEVVLAELEHPGSRKGGS